MKYLASLALLVVLGCHRSQKPQPQPPPTEFKAAPYKDSPECHIHIPTGQICTGNLDFLITDDEADCNVRMRCYVYSDPPKKAKP
jgi:hypothetical protein